MCEVTRNTISNFYVFSLQSAGDKIDASKFSFSEPEPLYDLISPLRVLSQRESNPEHYKLFCALESHLAQWKKQPDFVEAHRFVSDYLIKTLKMKDVDEDLVMRIFGNFYTNDFSTNVGGTGGYTFFDLWLKLRLLSNL